MEANTIVQKLRGAMLKVSKWYARWLSCVDNTQSFDVPPIVSMLLSRIRTVPHADHQGIFEAPWTLEPETHRPLWDMLNLQSLDEHAPAE